MVGFLNLSPIDLSYLSAYPSIHRCASMHLSGIYTLMPTGLQRISSCTRYIYSIIGIIDLVDSRPKVNGLQCHCRFRSRRLQLARNEPQLWRSDLRRLSPCLWTRFFNDLNSSGQIITTSLRPKPINDGECKGNHPLWWPNYSGEWIIVIYPDSFDTIFTHSSDKLSGLESITIWSLISGHDISAKLRWKFIAFGIQVR